MASCSSSSSSLKEEKYEVFLSFRGEDTCSNFASDLNAALCQKQLKTFVDDSLRRGDNERSPLISEEVIEESKLALIIFSKYFASSTWCLDVLVKILECKRRNGQIIVPVFYHVDPSDVEKQTGYFGDAFVNLEEQFKEEMDKVHRWRAALREVANLSGWVSLATRPESKLINEIVESVKLNCENLNDIRGLVGLQPRLEEIEKLLSIGLADFRIIGIWGMAGIGKTTVATAIFKRISYQFESSCFVANVREESEKHGLTHLRKMLFSKLLGLRISTPDFGFTFTKHKLQRKRVLVVLDDINNLRQIEFLVGGHGWFGLGSRIVVTSRDNQVLKNVADETYEVKELDRHDSLQLFVMNAFKQDIPKDDDLELSNKVVDYVRGNPLALKVLGSSFFGKTKQEWKSALDKLKEVRNEEIQNVLKISYDGLDSEEKDIFLDIACFFKGKEIGFVKRFLDGCGFFSDIGLSILIDKCLITIFDNRLQMHDLLQDMGWEIVLKESIKEPGKRSRLWRAEDVHHVLTKNLGTRRIEAISLNMSAVSEIQVDFKAFFAMTNLRLLEFYTPEMGNYKVHLPHGLMSLPDKLRYLRWDGYPLKSFPSNFVPQNLVELILSDGKVEQLWIGVQNLVNLKRISLRACNHLIAIPDLSRATNLEEIDLSHCISLVDVFSSIRCLNKLIHLNIISCKSLRNLPSSINMDTRGDAAEELQDDICSWKSLQYLSVHGCSRLAKFPEISGNIKQLDLSGTSIKDVPTSIGCLSGLVDLALRNCSKLESLPGSICQLKLLEILQVDGTSIKELPSQIENLQGLVELSLSNCKDLVKLPEKIGHLKSLRKLVLNGCNLLEIPDSIGCLSSLKALDLSENNFEILPACISELSRLLYLGLKYCKRFQSLPQLPPRLILLDAHECTSLETVSGLLTRLKKYNFEFIFTNCLKLDESTQRTILLYVQMSFLRGRYPYSFHFPGRTIPKWFVNQSRGSSLTIHLPPDWFNCKFLGFTLCAVVKFQDYLADSGFQVLGSYHFKDSYSHHLHFSFCFGGWDAEQGHPRSIVSDHLLLGFDPSLYAEGYEIFSQHYYNEVLIEFRFLDRFLKPVGTECKVKKCGARLAYAQDEKNASSMMRETKRCCDDNYYNEAELCGCGNDGSNKKRDCKRFKETNYIHNAWP